MTDSPIRHFECREEAWAARVELYESKNPDDILMLHAVIDEDEYGEVVWVLLASVIGDENGQQRNLYLREDGTFA